MKKDITKTESYEKPTIVDHGDLTELTAGLKGGSTTDASFPVHTPQSQITFVSGP
jgi:hypothetical protein